VKDEYHEKKSTVRSSDASCSLAHVDFWHFAYSPRALSVEPVLGLSQVQYDILKLDLGTV
jgi:hypothetical protein